MSRSVQHASGRHAPLVSVCIPTFNRREDLSKTLASLRAQTFDDYEVIVCDDASTDGTAEMLEKLGWDRLHVLRNERNLNLYGSMTRLFASAHGTYVGMQHDHDLYETEFLEQMVGLLERLPSAGFGCCAYSLIDAEDRVISRPRSAEFDLFPASGLLAGHRLREALATGVHTPIPAMGTMYRREVVEAAGGYRPDWGLAADEDLYARVAAISDVAFTPERLFRLRLRPEERHRVLGSWESLLTLRAFRQDLLRQNLSGRRMALTARNLALRARYARLFVGEAMVLWTRGEAGQLRRGFELATRSEGPWHMTPAQRVLFGAGIEVLAQSAALGERLGDYWRRYRQRARGGRSTA